MHLLSVTVPPGDHAVELAFGPGPVDALAAVSTGVGLLACSGVAFWAHRSRGIGA